MPHVKNLCTNAVPPNHPTQFRVLICNVPSRVDITNSAILNVDGERLAPYDGLFLFGQIENTPPILDLAASVACQMDGG